MPIVTLDAGHGGKDPGAVGFGVFEKDICLDRVLRVRDYLATKYPTIQTVLTRSDDTFIHIGDRVRISNRNNSDLFVSFHNNGFENPQARGFETFIHPNASANARDFQKLIHPQLAATMDSPDRGMKTMNLQVLRQTNAPAILLEELFITNPRDNAILLSKEQAITYSTTVAEAIARWFNVQEEEPQLIYRVVAGSFRNHNNAINKISRLRDAGFDAFIEVVRG